MASKRSSRRWLVVFASILLVGIAVEYYARALGAFILIEARI